MTKLKKQNENIFKDSLLNRSHVQLISHNFIFKEALFSSSSEFVRERSWELSKHVSENLGKFSSLFGCESVN